MRNPIVVGSRGSRLALVQTQSVLSGLTHLHPGREFRLVKIRTTGDIKARTPLSEISSHGIFVKELQAQLLEGRIDAAVHSLKDLPLLGHPGLTIAAVTPRADPRDALVSRGKTLSELDPGSSVGTGSPRRRSQLLAVRPDLMISEIRGNIETRLKKVSEGQVDGIVVAAAGLIRLGWEERVTEYLSIENFLPEPGQGALAVETRGGDRDIFELVRPLHHEPTWTCVSAERAFALALGGGCSAPVACLGTVSGSRLELRGMVADAGSVFFASEEGEAGIAEIVAQRLAGSLKKSAAAGAGRSGEK